MITILMATYNGERFIEQQLESILKQTIQDFHLIVFDDCSTDRTWEILQRYSVQQSERIQIYQNKENTGNAKYNFMQMMFKIKDEYMMLCDQDDVWLPDKIEKTLSEVINLEQCYGKHTPLMIQTDLIVVDEQLEVISHSFQKMSEMAPTLSFKETILSCNLTGCTVLYNRSLAKMLIEQPKEFVMHDWWLALVCAAFGYSSNIQKGTVLYRQHDNNVIGAQKVKGFSYYLHKLTHTKEIKESLFASYRQARDFLRIYEHQLSDEQRRSLSQYSKLLDQHKLARIYNMIRHHLLRRGWKRTISQLLNG